jgi:hypothetical protein
MDRNPLKEQATAAAAARKPYARPALRRYGDVRFLTRGTGVTANGDAGQMMMVTSDRAAKENLVRVGTHPLGIGLYLFDYRPAYRDAFGHGRQFGAMADEVETVLPQAVSAGPRGLKQVNYALLGIRPVVG